MLKTGDKRKMDEQKEMRGKDIALFLAFGNKKSN